MRQTKEVKDEGNSLLQEVPLLSTSSMGDKQLTMAITALAQQTELLVMLAFNARIYLTLCVSASKEPYLILNSY